MFSFFQEKSAFIDVFSLAVTPPAGERGPCPQPRCTLHVWYKVNLHNGNSKFPIETYIGTITVNDSRSFEWC